MKKTKITQEWLRNKFFEECEKQVVWGYAGYKAHIHVAQLGPDLKTRYGSYKWVSPEDIEGREFHWEFLDGKVGIFWDDFIYVPPRYFHLKIWEKDDAANSVSG